MLCADNVGVEPTVSGARRCDRVADLDLDLDLGPRDALARWPTTSGAALASALNGTQGAASRVSFKG